MPTHASVISAEIITHEYANPSVAVDQSLLYPSPYKEFWHAFSRNKGAVAGLMFMLLVIFCAIFAPWVARITPASNTVTSC